jgi:collagenase-like PrtC family protease
MSGYQYNLINEVRDMQTMGVDVIRISPDSELALQKLEDFRKQLVSPKQYPLDGQSQCNGYWHKIAGMSVL